jgi:putative aldouronate transport system permease protein
MKRRLDTRGSSFLFLAMVYGVLGFFLLSIALPLLYVLFTSFASKTEILSRGFFIIPKDWTINSYGYLFTDPNFIRSMTNSIYILFVGTLINMVLTTLMAYGLSKSWLKGRRMLNLMIVFSMLFNGGMIPLYFVVRGLGLIDSTWALFLTVAILPFNLIVLRTFFINVPSEVEESARMDGCSEVRLLWSIVIPLSLPVIVTIALFYGVEHWNTYFNAILYLNDGDKWPLQVFLRQMLIQPDEQIAPSDGGFEYSPGVRMAGVVITALPMLIIYLSLQRYFNQGFMVGSVKG